MKLRITRYISNNLNASSKLFPEFSLCAMKTIFKSLKIPSKKSE